MGEIRRFVCVVCPRGCQLEVEGDGAGGAAVRGNGCAKGADYGRAELLDPRRSLTTTVATAFPGRPRLPVRSSGGIPLARLVEAARSLDGLLVKAPARRGEVVVRDLLGLGVDMVATDDLLVGDDGLPLGDAEPARGAGGRSPGGEGERR